MSNIRKQKEDGTIYAAMAILESRVRQPEAYISGPNDVKNLLRLKLADRDAEAFVVVFLDTRHGVIAIEEMFQGGLDSAAVYVGRIARRALLLNAAAIIVAHNHPSGIPTPSSADKTLTERIRQAMMLLEMRLLDHIIIAGREDYSFADHGLI